jgi:hypothetical protein
MKTCFPVLLLFLLNVSCNKNNLPEGRFAAKLVASLCSHYVVEITDSRFQKTGMDWKDGTGKQYNNVFTVKNYCDFGKAGLKTGDRFTAILVDSATQAGCAVCLAYMETPPLQLTIQVVE